MPDKDRTGRTAAAAHMIRALFSYTAGGGKLYCRRDVIKLKAYKIKNCLLVLQTSRLTGGVFFYKK